MRKKLLVFKVFTFLAVAIVLMFIPGIRTFVHVIYINTKEVTEFTVNEDKLFMNGLINSKTFTQLKRVVEENPQIETIIMLDVPGSADDEVNLSMGLWVRNKGFKTYLTSTSHVASGGTDFFLAGVERTIEEEARLGVHSWGYGMGRDGSDFPRSDPVHEMNRRYIEIVLGKDDFYWYTIDAAPADDMHYMSLDEIEKYGLYTRFIPSS